MGNKLIESRAAKWGLLVSLVAVFALISGLYLPGCSENPATSSEVNLSQDETSFFDQPFDEAAFARLVEPTPIELDAVVDVETLYGEALFTTLDGGDITIGTAGNYHYFSLGANAVPYDVTISMEITKIEAKSKKDAEVAVIYEFRPDGLEFLVPGELSINVAKVLGKRATCLRFYYLDEQTGVWQFQGEYCAGPDGFARIPIEHFSRYGIE